MNNSATTMFLILTLPQTLIVPKPGKKSQYFCRPPVSLIFHYNTPLVPCPLPMTLQKPGQEQAIPVILISSDFMCSYQKKTHCLRNYTELIVAPDSRIAFMLLPVQNPSVNKILKIRGVAKK